MLDCLISIYRRYAPQQVRLIIASLLGYHSPFAKNRSTVRVRDFIGDYNALAGADGQCPVIQDSDAALKALHRQFDSRGVRSESLSGEWWKLFAKAITLYDKEGKGIQSRLRSDIDEVPASQMMWWEWLSIYNLLLKFGLFNIAYGIRLKIRESILIELQSGKIKSGTYAHLKALGILVELRQWHLLKSEIDKLKPWHSEDKFLLEMLLAMGSDHNNLKNLKRLSLSKKDHFFNQLNTNKKIAYVGPAKTENMDGAEIEKFDVVVRANHKSISDSQSVLPSKGLRCDISYYNGLQSRRLAELKESIPAEVKFAIAVQDNLKYLKKLPPSKSNKRYFPLYFRTARNHRSLLIQGSFHGMPNAIIDILKCSPKEIKVFHADLMLTINRSKGYKYTAEDTSQHAKVFLNTITNHDPIIQWSFLEIPYKAGLLDGDSMFKHVMDIGEERYMQSIQEVYGDFARLIPSQCRSDGNLNGKHIA